MMMFTADMDWAPEAVIEDTLSIFESYGVPCSLYATGRSEVLLNCNKSLFEVGIHPDFNPLLRGEGGSVDETLGRLFEIYPDAKGVRSHSLTQSGMILERFKTFGAEYELNHFLPYHQGLKPFALWNDLVRIPFNWEDDYHFALRHSFNGSLIDLSDDEFNIFNFHPIHIYLNSEDDKRYNCIKHDMQNVRLLDQHRNVGPVKGVRDLLVALCEIAAPKTHFRMRDVATACLENAGAEVLRVNKG